MLYSVHKPIFFLFFLLVILPTPSQAVFGDGPESGKTSTLKEIIVEGNTRTDLQLILNEMGLEIGQAFDRELMNKIWIMLEDIGYFAFVDMEYEDLGSDGVILNVSVEEDMTMAYGPLVRYSRRQKYLIGAWFEEQNLRGKGEKLSIDLAGLFIQRGEISWTKPWLAGVQGLKMKLSALGENSNFVFRPTRQKIGWGELEIRWNFMGDFYVAGNLNYGQTQFADSYYWADPVTGNPVLHQAGTVAHLATGGLLGYDSRDNPWYPSGGLFAEAGARHWASDDFTSYTEATANLSAFIPVPLGKHVLALHAWGRRTDGPSHLENNLFFGGPETIRGYQFAGLEGDEGYLLSAEYRIPLFMMPISAKGEMVGVGLHLFGDAGDAWHDGLDPGLAVQSWGGGLHLNIDKVQLRFEGAKTSEGDWVFEFMDQFNF